ncbi:MAG TPA: saccharopine dehydrogenase NADP-binding domain-containing protein, partial [Ilumatobacteraceae bacterium]
MTSEPATKLTLVGAGKIGQAIVQLLSTAPEYDVTVIDRDEDALTPLRDRGVSVFEIDISDPVALADYVDGQDMVLSAAPFYATSIIATAARNAGAHYFDLTEDVESTRVVKRLAIDATSALVPQCGLAPGFVSIAAAELARSFDDIRSISMRVGALPQFPTNAFKYNLTWSTDGLINEYCNPCEAIVDGKMLEVLPLEEVEAFSLDG